MFLCVVEVLHNMDEGVLVEACLPQQNYHLHHTQQGDHLAQDCLGEGQRGVPQEASQPQEVLNPLSFS